MCSIKTDPFYCEYPFKITKNQITHGSKICQIIKPVETLFPGCVIKTSSLVTFQYWMRKKPLNTEDIYKKYSYLERWPTLLDIQKWNDVVIFQLRWIKFKNIFSIKCWQEGRQPETIIFVSWEAKMSTLEDCLKIPFSDSNIHLP